MPSPSDWQLAWGELAAVALLATGYLVASRRHRLSPWRQAAFAAALALVLPRTAVTEEDTF